MLLSVLQASLRSSIIYLEEEEDATMESRHRNKAPVKCNLESLPDHILVNIIAGALPPCENENIPRREKAWIHISKVSRRFCWLVYSTSSFWAHICTDMDPVQTERSLAFSRKAELYVEFGESFSNRNEEGNTSLLPIRSLLKDHRRRWKSLCVHDIEEETWSEVKRTVDQAAVSGIRSLQLTKLGYISSWDPSVVFAEWTFPFLTSLTMHRCVPPVYVVKNLTSLSIGLPLPRDGGNLTSIVHILLSAPLLQELEVSMHQRGRIPEGQIDVEPEVANLSQLKRLVICESFKSDEHDMMFLGSPWLTRALKTPVLSSVVFDFGIHSDGPLDRTRLQFFPADAHLEHVEHVSLSISTALSGKHYKSRISFEDAILSRFPCVKSLDMSLAKYAPLIHYVREYPSIRSLTLLRLPSSILRATEFLDFVQWIERGEHEIERFYLLTRVCRPKRLITKMDEYVGGTLLKWDEVVA